MSQCVCRIAEYRARSVSHLSLAVLLLASLRLTTVSASTEDVSWLADVTTVPAHVVQEHLGKLTPLLVDEAGLAITRREGWALQRQIVRAAWMTFLGAMPEPRPPVRLKMLTTQSYDTVTRQLVRYEGEPGLFVEGYLGLLNHRQGHMISPGSFDRIVEWLQVYLAR